METPDQNSPSRNSTPRLFLVVPPGLNAAAVLARKAAILSESPGMDPLRVEQLAIDAERAQHWHDHPESRASGQFGGGKSEAETLASSILDAQATDRALAAAAERHAAAELPAPNELATPEKA